MTPARSRMQVFSLLGASLLLISCGGGGGGATAPAGTTSTTPPSNTIYVGTGGEIGPYGEAGTDSPIFTPVTLTVTAGTTVTWVFKGINHSVESGAGCSADQAFSSGIKAKGSSFTRTFTEKGVYPFFCVTHCGSDAMKGTITVQ